MNTPWQSNPIAVDGFELRISTADGRVNLGRISDGIYASDFLLTPDQTRRLARALLEGADKAEAQS